MDDFDDLLTTPRKRGRPTKEEAARRAEEATRSLEMQAEIRRAAIGQTAVAEKEFFLPVGVNFLVRVLRMDPQTVRTRLRNVSPLPGSEKRNVWYFHDVLPYLVKPKMTAEQFARTLNKADLPPEINKSFWDSQRSRVKYKIEAQEAWETEDVMRVLGEVAMIFKDSTTMVVEEMRNRAKLTDEQTEILQGCIDELRKEVREKLVDMPAQSHTPSMFGKPMFGVSAEIDTHPDIPDVWDDGEDDEE